jgi:hypothetical protein
VGGLPCKCKVAFTFNKEKKALYIKIKDGNPSIKSIRQMRSQVDTIQKKEEEANNQQK